MWNGSKKVLVVCLSCRKKKVMTAGEAEKFTKCECGSSARSVADLDQTK